MKVWMVVALLGGCVDSTVETAPVCRGEVDCDDGMAPGETRTARVIWTIEGQPPNAESCSWTSHITVQFWTEPEPPRATWESAELDCTLGELTVENLPVRFWIGGATSPSNGMWVPLDDDGVAVVDLHP